MLEAIRKGEIVSSGAVHTGPKDLPLNRTRDEVGRGRGRGRGAGMLRLPLSRRLRVAFHCARCLVSV